MDALTARHGKSVFAACLCVTLTAWATTAHAEPLAVRLTGRDSAVEFAPPPAAAPIKMEAAKATAGHFLALFAAGTVLFGDSPSDFTPPTPDGPPVDNPIPPQSNPVIPVSPNTPLTPVIPATPGGGVQGNPNPEPASLLIGLIGSACAGAAVWRGRRRKAKAV